MSLEYTLIIPYHRTPTVTRIALSALSHSCTGNPEVLLVHTDPEPTDDDLAMFAEFSALRVLSLPSRLRGEAAWFAAIDAGVAAATHDRVGILHSDTVLLRPGWDEDLFGYMERDKYDAVGTQAEEATPFRSWGKRISDLWRELSHKRSPGPQDRGALRLHFLLTRKSALEKMDFRFSRQGTIDMHHYTQGNCRIGLLSLQEICEFMWHIPYTSRLLRGELQDSRRQHAVLSKWRIFVQDPHILSIFPNLIDPFAGMGSP